MEGLLREFAASQMVGTNKGTTMFLAQWADFGPMNSILSRRCDTCQRRLACNRKFHHIEYLAEHVASRFGGVIHYSRMVSR